jgi:hypothetical protein
MKKYFYIFTLLSIFSTSIFAASSNTRLWIGFSGNKLDLIDYDSSSLGYSLGITGLKNEDSGIVWGGGMDFLYNKIEGSGLMSDIYSYSFSFEGYLGYNLFEYSNLYAILGARRTNYDNNSANGFGYGLGIDYKFNSFGLAAEIKRYDMNIDMFPDNSNHDQYILKLFYSF